MKITNNLLELCQTVFQDDFGVSLNEKTLLINETKKEFEGDYTIVCFPLARYSKKSPEETADYLGKRLCGMSQIVENYNVVKGFLNIQLTSNTWPQLLASLLNSPILTPKKNVEKVMIEYSSPNVNKPLHLGHIRNILLGWSMVKLYQAGGATVIKTQIANDRGIAICKSMLSWKKFSNKETPESSGMKGDHLVGKYYVEFEKRCAEEYRIWQSSKEGKAIVEESKKEVNVFLKEYKNTYFNTHSELGREAREYLQKWENGDEEIRSLWSMMNGWVYDGYDETYEKLGVDFDKIYYESDTYLLGKEMIQKGIEQGVFYQKEDTSVWIDLESRKLDHKLVLRSDGTSVYITQDIGTAQLRYEEYGFDKMIYVVANEQDYHFKVLFETLDLLKEPYAKGLHHLSYGMVDLPEGRMKTREGTVVDADDLIADMISQVKKNSEDRGGLEGIPSEKKEIIYKKIALGALKFFILKVNAKKRMIFNPAESVDLQGHTGPYVQNAYVRIRSILKKSEDSERSFDFRGYEPLEVEKTMLKKLLQFDEIVRMAIDGYDPSQVANFAYDLAKEFHRFYHEAPILKADEVTQNFRLSLISKIAEYLQYSFELLGIEMPERM